MFRRNNKFIIYNTLTMKRKIFEARNRDEVMKKYYDKLQSLKVIVPNNFSPKKALEKYFKNRYENTPAFSGVIYFMLGFNCNMNCKYCFIKKSNEKINKATIDKLLEMCKENKNERIHIRFYGGEPLLYFSQIKYIIKRVKELGLESTYALPTNGTLLNEKICKFIKKHDISVMVSIDGPEEINDLMRVDINNNGTFEKIVNGIKILEYYDIQYQIAVTIHNHNINELPEVINYLYETFHPSFVNFNYPYLTQSLQFKYSTDYLVDKVFEAINKSREFETLPGNFYEDKVKPFLTETPTSLDCGGVEGHIVVLPSNNISPCIAAQGIDRMVKDLNSYRRILEIFRDDPFQKWKRLNLKALQDCHYCPAISICGGGCPIINLKKENIFLSDEINCKITKRSLEYLLESELNERQTI